MPKRLHGDAGGTGDAFGPDLSMESLFGSPSSIMIWGRSLCGRLIGRVGDEEEVPPFLFPLGEEVGVPRVEIWRESALAPTSSV